MLLGVRQQAVPGPPASWGRGRSFSLSVLQEKRGSLQEHEHSALREHMLLVLEKNLRLEEQVSPRGLGQWLAAICLPALHGCLKACCRGAGPRLSVYQLACFSIHSFSKNLPYVRYCLLLGTLSQGDTVSTLEEPTEMCTDALLCLPGRV